MPAGRPTTYDPIYCDYVIEWGKAGKSLAWMASEIGVSKQSIYEWASVHPEFSDALNISRAHAQRWWEDAGQDGMKDNKINASIWSRSMAARFPDDWREKNETALTGAGGGPIKQETNVIYTPEEAYKRMLNGE